MVKENETSMKMGKTAIEPSIPLPELVERGTPFQEKNSHVYPEDDESPIRAIVCLSKSEDMKRFEETEECFILEFNPFDSVDLSKLSFVESNTDCKDSDDVSVIAEKGQVACRDYPHSRHLCLEFPFNTTAHEKYCKMCYCYVCDSSAPCEYWTQPVAAHCNAENVGYWNDQRNLKKLQAVIKK
ncbi:hypothetical protein L6164_030253 [Bauhinia variegata]|uniref:Uncharacterized protein n=1 Tax=Bauhinia variegata TaxID=167791 RepID=A0ACB9LD27_BAUVA|nr:hypothetical protein L6164_030253 [Bauhinia variegata]